MTLQCCIALAWWLMATAAQVCICCRSHGAGWRREGERGTWAPGGKFTLTLTTSSSRLPTLARWRCQAHTHAVTFNKDKLREIKWQTKCLCLKCVTNTYLSTCIYVNLNASLTHMLSYMHCSYIYFIFHGSIFDWNTWPGLANPARASNTDYSLHELI